MTIVASCGHEVDDISHTWDYATKDFSRTGGRAVGYMSLCKECFDFFAEHDMILYTEEQEMEWLSGKIDQQEGNIMSETETQSRSCEVLEYKENPDGSATVTFDFTDQEIQTFFRAGVLEALKRGIEQAAVLDPNGPRRNTTFEMTWDQIDAILIKELQDIYERNEENEKLCGAVDELLQYIMTFSDYARWAEQKGRAE